MHITREEVDLEARLRRVLDRYRVVLDNIQDVVAVHDMRGRVAWVSKSVQEVLGYTPEEWRDLDIHTLIHPDDYARMRETGHPLPKDGRDVRVQYRIRHKDGRWIWVETLSTPIYNGRPDPIATQSHTRDITDIIVRERRMQSELAFHSALFNNALIPMAIFSPEGTFREVNTAWVAMLGYRAEELQELTFQQVTHFVSHEQDDTMYAALMSGDTHTVEGIKHFIKKDGTTVMVYIWGGSILDDHGQVVALFALAQTMSRILDLAHRTSLANDYD